jgi:hypothetical protein
MHPVGCRWQIVASICNTPITLWRLLTRCLDFKGTSRACLKAPSTLCKLRSSICEAVASTTHLKINDLPEVGGHLRPQTGAVLKREIEYGGQDW